MCHDFLTAQLFSNKSSVSTIDQILTVKVLEPGSNQCGGTLKVVEVQFIITVICFPHFHPTQSLLYMLNSCYLENHTRATRKNNSQALLNCQVLSLYYLSDRNREVQF